MKTSPVAESLPAASIDDLREVQAQHLPAILGAMRAALLCIDEGNTSRAAVVLSSALKLVEPRR